MQQKSSGQHSLQAFSYFSFLAFSRAGRVLAMRLPVSERITPFPNRHFICIAQAPNSVNFHPIEIAELTGIDMACLCSWRSRMS
jgi:hypothetical protein